MCFVLIGCWPCGHMKPIRTRFCDQAEPIQTGTSPSPSRVPPTSPSPSAQQQKSPARHGHHTPTGSSSQSPPHECLLSLHHRRHHHPLPPSTAATTALAATAALAPCPKGVNQYDHEPARTCPVCRREPVDVVAERSNERQMQQYLLQQLSSSSSSTEWKGGQGTTGLGMGSDGTGESVMRALTDEQLEAQLFWNLGRTATDDDGMARMNVGVGMGTAQQQRQLLTPPAEVMVAGTEGGGSGMFGAFGGDAVEAKLFGWC